MRRIKFGLIGCGSAALNYHLPAIYRTPEAELVALVDKDIPWAEKVAHHFLIPKFYSDYQALFSEVEAAVVALPPYLHSQVSIDLLRQGIHVLCEKPMAISLKECESMLQASQEGGSKLVISHQRRFRPNIAYLRNIISKGWLGKIIQFEYQDGWKQRNTSRTDFLFRRELTGGGHLIEYGVHVIDILQWLFGEPQSYRYADDCDSKSGMENNLEMEMSFTNGVAGVVKLSRSKELRNRFSITGDKGWVELVANETLYLKVFKRDSKLCSGYGPITVKTAEEDNCFVEQLRCFIEYIRGGSSFHLATGEEGLRTISIIEECYKSRLKLGSVL